MKKNFLKSGLVTIIIIMVPILIMGALLLGKYFGLFSPNEEIKSEEKEKPIIELSKDEYELLVHLVSAEASICSDECKRDVASVVINRLNSGKWGDTITEVIYYKNAFTPATFGNIFDETPDKSCYDAVNYVLYNGCTIPTYVRYFRTDYDFKWDGYKNYKIIDNVYFGYFEDWKNGAW